MMNHRRLWTNPVAATVPFSDDIAQLNAKEVQTAIDNLKLLVDGNAATTIYPFIASYNGNANAGRYLEVFPGQASDDSPEPFIVDSEIVDVYLRTQNTSGDFTVGFFRNSNLLTPVFTITLPAGVQALNFSGSLFTFLAGELATIQVTGGSRQKPTLKAFVRTQSGVTL